MEARRNRRLSWKARPNELVMSHTTGDAGASLLLWQAIGSAVASIDRISEERVVGDLAFLQVRPSVSEHRIIGNISSSGTTSSASASSSPPLHPTHAFYRNAVLAPLATRPQWADSSACTPWQSARAHCKSPSLVVDRPPSARC